MWTLVNIRRLPAVPFDTSGHSAFFRCVQSYDGETRFNVELCDGTYCTVVKGGYPIGSFLSKFIESQPAAPLSCLELAHVSH